tara:strand:- start:1603 stop:1815 length:213 start_codon:yes stop_codon:yes gene_type:complete
MKRTRKRTRQQLIDPWSVPPTEPIEVYVVEESDNITEEIEYTLEQLRSAYEMSEEEKDKIWSNHKENKNE